MDSTGVERSTEDVFATERWPSSAKLPAVLHVSARMFTAVVAVPMFTLEAAFTSKFGPWKVDEEATLSVELVITDEPTLRVSPTMTLPVVTVMPLEKGIN